MSGGEALDLALGLLRAPARRSLLAARPLPSGMGTLLEVAGGSPAAARDAAGRIGTTPEEMLEAARFFVQQIQLAEDADAYRILGVERDAGTAHIRDHHRLLLRWLHPDRSQGEQWESALATRVNQAWTQLRTPAARAAYDRRRPAHSMPPQPHANPSGFLSRPAPVPQVALEPAAARRPGAAAIGLAALALACLGLGWLAFKGGSEPVTPEFRRASVPAPVPLQVSPPEPREDAYADLREVAAVAAVAGQQALSAATRNEPVPEAPLAPPAPPAPPARVAIMPAAATVPVVVESPAVPDFAVVEPLPSPVPAAATAADPLQLFESANAAVDALSGWLASRPDAQQPAYAGLPVRMEAVDTRLRLHERLGQGATGRLSLDQRDWRLGEQHATVAARYRLTARGRERETGSARIGLARHDDQWQLASLNLVADP